MKKQLLLTMILSGLLGIHCAQNVSADAGIESAIDNWYEAWETKDVELAIKNYAENVDWTNAFGDRVQSQTALKELLTRIFAMNFVMSGHSENQFNDITYLAENVAIVRSKVVRTDQKWSDKSSMDDRHINHLRVFELQDGEWKIVSHMISQAQAKK